MMPAAAVARPTEEHGWPSDAWPAIHRQVLDADILVLCGPIWLGDNSSVMKRVIERLYACSSLLNEAGQYAYYGRVGGRLRPHRQRGRGQALRHERPLQPPAPRLHDPAPGRRRLDRRGRPGPSYLDPGGPENDFTNRNTTFATWNLLHLGALLKRAGGVPAHGNQRSEWEAGCRLTPTTPNTADAGPMPYGPAGTGSRSSAPANSVMPRVKSTRARKPRRSAAQWISSR